jgi:hypothetical protein
MFTEKEKKALIEISKTIKRKPRASANARAVAFAETYFGYNADFVSYIGALRRRGLINDNLTIKEALDAFNDSPDRFVAAVSNMDNNDESAYESLDMNAFLYYIDFILNALADEWFQERLTNDIISYDLRALNA